MVLNMNPNDSNPADYLSSLHDHLPMLKDSITVFFAQHSRGATDFSDIGNLLLRNMPKSPEAQLEIAWFYSAMRFHTAAQDPSRRLAATMDTFQVLLSLSSSFSVLKKIAVIAPVVYELCHLAREREDLKDGIVDFLEGGVVNHIGFCLQARPNEDGGNESLSSFFLDLLRVWTVNRLGEELRVFFPMVSDHAHEGNGLKCEVGYVAGLVMVEALFLLMCLKSGSGRSSEDIHVLAVKTLTDFQSFHFLDALLKMLSEAVLPVNFLLSSEDEVLLREALYDAVARVDYSFLIHQNVAQPLPKRLKHLTMSWLVVANKTLPFKWRNIDRTKVFSYLDAFKSSCLTSCLINWVLNQAKMAGKMSLPVDFSPTPSSVANFMRTVETQGVALFDKEDWDCYYRFFQNSKKTKEDNVDDEDMVDSVDNALSAIPETMNLITHDTRKRKESIKVEGGAELKFAKHVLHETLRRQNPSLWGDDDALSSGSEIDNSVTDEDAEDMEQ